MSPIYCRYHLHDGKRPGRPASIEQAAVLDRDAGTDGQAGNGSQYANYREEYDRYEGRTKDYENSGHGPMLTSPTMH